MIEYENTLEDIVAFNQYHLATSPSFNRAARLWSLVAILGAGAVILYRSGSWVWGLIAVGLGWLVTLWRPERRLVARMSGKAIREFLAEGKNDSILALPSHS